ncbi:MAG: hypothetical protein ACI9JY_002446, partial [Saprospiraceae bacterium]
YNLTSAHGLPDYKSELLHFLHKKKPCEQSF